MTSRPWEALVKYPCREQTEKPLLRWNDLRIELTRLEILCHQLCTLLDVPLRRRRIIGRGNIVDLLAVGYMTSKVVQLWKLWFVVECLVPINSAWNGADATNPIIPSTVNSVNNILLTSGNICT